MSCGRYPARAVVGEHLPVAATVFREGHDAVAANVVLARPGRPGRPARSSGWCPGAPGTDRWHATVVPDRRGRAGRSRSRPGATRWPPGTTKVEVKIDAGQGPEDLANDLEDGARLCERALRTVPAERPRRARARRPRRCATPTATSPHRVGPALTAELQRLLHDHPVRELVTRSPALHGLGGPAAARCTAPGTSSSRARRAPRCRRPDGTPARHGTFKDAARRLPRSPQLGFDVVYLPPIHPIGKVNRKGRNNTLIAQARGRRLALGDRLRRGRARRDPPAAGHVRGLRRLRRARPASWAWRSRSTSPCRPRRTTRG